MTTKVAKVPDGLTNIERKAQAYLWAGKVRVHSVDASGAVVYVQGSGPEPYKVRFSGGTWVCYCPAHLPVCAHVVAARLVVNWEPVVGASFTGSNDELLDEIFSVPDAPIGMESHTTFEWDG